MAEKTGNLSINSENLFPIIKKWLYSDHDIFFRELVSNGCDAITKLKKLEMMGEAELPEDNEFKIEVIADAEKKTLTFIDNGIGMTAEEVEKYITQIAFSGAEAFLEKYKDKTNEDQIIGHFGLGFYSAFMVADKVTIETLSYRPDAKGVYWECDGESEYTIKDSDYNARGTKITLYLNENSLEFANEYRAKEVLNKYCSFMPVPIYLTNPNAEPQYDTIDAKDVLDTDTVIEKFTQEAKTEEVTKEDGTKETKEVSPACEKAKILRRVYPLNDTHPLWSKHPNECTDEDYKEFYRKTFADYKEPLFWIHLNMDYPFNLKGILYFPKINTEYESAEGVIKLYNNQVFIADNIKEVIPEFLMLLKGVIDCPDLPLNVSRSALQNDGFVKKISEYITKKVADKLSGMCKTDRDNYEKYWDDISPFIKYGCLKDEKFCERMGDYVLFKDINDKYQTLKDLIPEKDEKASDDAASTENASDDKKDEKKEEEKTSIYYVTDPVVQSQYIHMFKESGLNAVVLTHNIDQPFISSLEQKNEHIRFLRIDADVTNTFKGDTTLSEEDQKKMTDELTELFKKALNKDSVSIKVESLKDANVSSMVTLPEETRRMQDMMKMYNMYGMDPSMMSSGEILVLNANNNLVKYVLDHKDGEHTPMICQQLYDLAMICNKPLPADEMTRFIERSNQILSILAEK